jgi:hypothetical protein
MKLALESWLAGDPGSLEISASRCGREEDPADLRVTVSVEQGGFSAKADAWVLEEVWREFLSDLAILEEIGQGAALLEAMSPEELRLSFRSTDSAGHMAVEGFVGVRAAGHAAKLTFSPVAFDPTELPRVLRELRALAPNLGTPSR